MIKVLQVFASLGYGGAEGRMMDVYRKIDRKEYIFDFTTFSEEIGEYEDEIKALNGKVVRLLNPHNVNIFTHIHSLKQAIRDGHYDVVHAHTAYHCGIVMFVAWLEKIPVRISHARTSGLDDVTIPKYIFSLLGKALISIFSTYKIAISKEAGDFVFGKRKYEIIPNSIDFDKYLNEDDDPSFRNELGIDKSAFVIGQIARFVPFKNHKFSIEWFSQYWKSNKNSFLVFIGDGSLTDELKSYTEELGIEKGVIFAGIRDDIPRVLKSFNVLLHTSVYEGLGGVILEAQAAGIPVVASAAVPNVTDMGLGLVAFCELGQGHDAWNTAVNDSKNKLLPNQDMIKEAFEKRGYTVENTVRRYSQIYTSKLNING